MNAVVDRLPSSVSLDSERDPELEADLKARVDAFLAAAESAVNRSLSPNSTEFLQQHKQAPGE